MTDDYISRRTNHQDEFNYAFVSFGSETEAKAALETADEDGVFWNRVIKEQCLSRAVHLGYIF